MVGGGRAVRNETCEVMKESSHFIHMWKFYYHKDRHTIKQNELCLLGKCDSAGILNRHLWANVLCSVSSTHYWAIIFMKEVGLQYFFSFYCVFRIITKNSQHLQGNVLSPDLKISRKDCREHIPVWFPPTQVEVNVHREVLIPSSLHLFNILWIPGCFRVSPSFKIVDNINLEYMGLLRSHHNLPYLIHTMWLNN